VNTPSASVQPLAGAGLWLRVFLPFALGYYLSYALRTVNAVIAPDLTRELHVSAADLGLLTSAYFFAFGAFQIPLGMLLDRYGPRKVEAALLLFAAAGCVVFGMGGDLAQLGLGRALIGLGVSACLMAGFKSFSQWFPSERQPMLTASIMVAGTLGALSASLPLELALPAVGWRGVFHALAALSVLVALAILSVPDHSHGITAEPLSAQLKGVASVFGSAVFWRYAPQTALVVGGFMALQSLWAVPWLIEVNGYGRVAAAAHLLYLNLALLAGYLALAALAVPLARRGVKPAALLAGGCGLTVAMGGLILIDALPSWLGWAALGLSVCVGNLAYPLLTAHFPPQLAGRVNTALNLLAFVGAFGVQWGFGAVADAFAGGGPAQAHGFRVALGVLVALQAAAWLWFVLGLRGKRKG
jgi:predicted MFS family arabinose efflux permease